ncbi:MAG: family 10 glycosylhydrolase [Anaerolineae bacterium]|nr:family 10 glycosylhydrolase [Anaerolineae bacterium]
MVSTHGKKFVLAMVACALLATAVIVPLQARRAAARQPSPVPSAEPAGVQYVAPTDTPTSTPAPPTGQVGAVQVQPTDEMPSPQPTEPPPPAAQPPAPPEPMRETRAVWVSRFDLKDNRDIQRIVDNAALANMNVILFQVRGAADALYRPGLEPWSAILTGQLGADPGFDPLGEMITRAHEKGIEVHAWINAYPVWQGSTPPPANTTPLHMYHEFNARFRNEWLQWDASGPIRLGQRDYLVANPAHPAVQDRIVAVARDLLERYPLDGIHLDYIRYAGREFSQDPLSNRLYAEAAAQRPGLTREDWQRDQVTTLVLRVRDEALPVRPGARLTTTAWPAYKDVHGWYRGNDGYFAFYQDSQRWARDGAVTAILPMLYGTTIHEFLDRYETLARDYVENTPPGSTVLGIGADYDTFEPIAQRIEVTRRLGASGQAFFSYGALEDHSYWQALRDGPYSQPAVPAWR